MQDGHVCRMCMRTTVATFEGWQPCLREIKNSRLDDEKDYSSLLLMMKRSRFKNIAG